MKNLKTKLFILICLFTFLTNYASAQTTQPDPNDKSLNGVINKGVEVLFDKIFTKKKKVEKPIETQKKEEIPNSENKEINTTEKTEDKKIETEPETVYKTNPNSNFKGVISEKEMMVRKFVAQKKNLFDDKTINEYIQNFYKSYNENQNNEFERNKTQVKARNELKYIIDNLNENNTYYIDFEAKLGEYDFNNSEFKFYPIHEFKDENKTMQKHVAFTNFEDSGDLISKFKAAIDIRNLNFVQNIKIDSNVAQNFLKSRTDGYGNIDRRLYLRIYYLVYLDKIIDYKGGSWMSNIPNDCLLGEPLRVEAWEDKCRMSKLFTTFEPNNLPSQFIGIQDKLIKNDLVRNNERIPYPQLNEFKNIYNWSKLNDKCAQEYVELQMKIIKSKVGKKQLVFKLLTNYSHKIFPGFIFNFYNPADTNIEYPLTIVETSVEDGKTILKVAITDETKKLIIDKKAISIKIQISGTAKYTIEGKGVTAKGDYNWPSNEMWLTLSDESKQTLLSILKNSK